MVEGTRDDCGQHHQCVVNGIVFLLFCKCFEGCVSVERVDVVTMVV